VSDGYDPLKFCKNALKSRASSLKISQYLTKLLQTRVQLYYAQQQLLL